MASSLPYPQQSYSSLGLASTDGPRRTIKNLIWLYFWLLIFEGALRKWVMPGLATPLLIVRDPVVMAALALGFSSGILRWNGWMTATAVIGVASAGITMAIGHGNLIVTAFGFRANFLHIPMIFLMGSAFDRSDVEKLCRAFLFVSIGMILLIGLQFYSPQGSFVNVGLGGKGDAGFDGALGYRRPSGTFSFTTGVSIFFPFVAACSLYGMIAATKQWMKLLSIAGGLAVMASIPISISRGLMIGCLIVAVGGVIALGLAGKNVMRFVQTGVALCILAVGATFLPGLDKPRKAFATRWEMATERQGGVQKAILERSLEGATKGLTLSTTKTDTFFGHGLGAGTNAGAMLLTGSVSFLIAENESGRITGEMGYALGIAFIALRASLAFWLLFVAWKAAKRGDPLALILWFACGLSIAQGQWGQPTSLGFAILGAGMVLSAAQHASVGFVQQSRRRRHPTLTPQSPVPSTTPPKASLPAPAAPAKGPSGKIW